MDFHMPRALCVFACTSVAGIASHAAGGVYYGLREVGDLAHPMSPLWRFAILIGLTCILWGATFIIAGLPGDSWKD